MGPQHITMRSQLCQAPVFFRGCLSLRDARALVAAPVLPPPNLGATGSHSKWVAGPAAAAAPSLRCKGSTRRARSLLARTQKQVRS